MQAPLELNYELHDVSLTYLVIPRLSPYSLSTNIKWVIKYEDSPETKENREVKTTPNENTKRSIINMDKILNIKVIKPNFAALYE